MGNMIWSVVLLFALVHICAAKPLSRRWNDVAEKHSWVDIPRGWEYESPAPADFPFEMRIALKQHRIDELIGSLMETSDPNHERYVDLFVLPFLIKYHINTDMVNI
jgi:tripeptidyl-peptidase-1